MSGPVNRLRERAAQTQAVGWAFFRIRLIRGNLDFVWRRWLSRAQSVYNAWEGQRGLNRPLRALRRLILRPISISLTLASRRDLRGLIRHYLRSMKSIYGRLENRPALRRLLLPVRRYFLHPALITLALALRGEIREMNRRYVSSLKSIYSLLEKHPNYGARLRTLRLDVLRPALRLLRRPAGWRFYIRCLFAPRLLMPRRWRIRHEAEFRQKAKSLAQAERRAIGRSGFLYTYEFDAAATKYSDIKSIIEHHERSKRLVSPFYRALYDLRSGLVLRMAWIMADVLKHHAKSFDLDLAGFAPYKLLRDSCADLDPETQSIGFLRAAIEQEPMLAEAHYHLGIIYRAMDRAAEAERCYRAVTKLPPTIVAGPHDIPLPARASYELGLVLQRLTRYDEARQSFQQAVDLSDAFYDAHQELGGELARAGEYGEAAEHLQRSMYYRPNLQVLPRLPERLQAALSAGQAVFHDPEIVELLLDRPVPIPPLVCRAYRDFRVFELYGRHYGVPDDGDITYAALLNGHHSVLFESGDQDSIIRSIDAHLKAHH